MRLVLIAALGTLVEACGSQATCGSGPLCSNPHTLGTRECQLSGSACPPGCQPVTGWLVDPSKLCLQSPGVVTCSSDVSTSAVVGCSVRNSQIFEISDFELAQPAYAGWRLCMSSEMALLGRVHSRCN